MPHDDSRSPRQRLHDELRRAFDGGAWHGPSLAEALAGVSAADAAARPAAGVHGIWELALHLTAWTLEVARRLAGAPAAEPAEGDWPSVPADASEEAWAAARKGVERARDVLLQTLDRVPADRLAEPAPTVDEPATAAFTHADMLHGVAQHTAYHGGQIVLLRRLRAASADHAGT
jgi:uncharacterized damage-inducible protein DinB